MTEDINFGRWALGFQNNLVASNDGQLKRIFKWSGALQGTETASIIQTSCQDAPGSLQTKEDQYSQRAKKAALPSCAKHILISEPCTISVYQTKGLWWIGENAHL